MSLLDNARTYVGSAFGPTYDAWLALDDATATKTLGSAARYLNVLPWQGTFGGTLTLATDLVWPRTGVVVDGVPVDPLTTPVDVQDAQYEMAVLILTDPTIVTKVDQGSNVQSVGGGGAPTVAFFAPTSALRGTAPRLPYVVLQLVGKYLAVPEIGVGGFGQPGDSTSAFGTASQFRLVLPE